MTGMLEVEDAQRQLLALAPPLPLEHVEVEQAHGRYLAEALVAQRSQPFADLSAMDGYAICGAERTNWTIIGESAAGRPFAGTLHQSECVTISTGAAVPADARGVIPFEMVSRKNQRIDLSEPPPEPFDRFIRRQGSDFHAGDRLLRPGTRISSRVVALALTAGTSELPVRRRPKVAVLQTGDELIAKWSSADRGKTPAANGPMVAAMLRNVPCDVAQSPIVTDRLERVISAIEDAGDQDVLVTIGGASIGEHDLVRPALERLGFEIAFWRVAMKPGKPLLVAKNGSQIALGLPGNPASAFVTSYLFLLPLIRAALGSASPSPAPSTLPLAAPLPHGGGRREFVRAVLERGELTPLPSHDSGFVAALAQATHLIDRPANAPPAREKDVMPCYSIENCAPT